LNRDQGITILFVTHDPETAEYCERVVFIRDGVIARDEYRQVTVGIHAPAEGQTAPPNYYSVMSNLFQGAPDAAAAPVDTDASPSPISPAEAVNVAEDNKPPDQALSQSAAPASVETPPADANQAAPMEAAQPETAVDAEAAEDVALEASAEKAAQVAEPPLPPVIAPLPTQPARREFPIL
jgi:energy-coupling factor transporter ATP-binding protein EcfA2